MSIGPYLICLADALKVPKESRKMPAVKKLHQSFQNNTKPPFIFEHSLQVISLLAGGPDGPKLRKLLVRIIGSAKPSHYRQVAVQIRYATTRERRTVQ